MSQTKQWHLLSYLEEESARKESLGLIVSPAADAGQRKKHRNNFRRYKIVSATLIAALILANTLQLFYNNNNNNNTKRRRNKTNIYGFVHMAKTAGTEINGQLASHYERVCGNKGSSHDYFQYNSRLRDWAKDHDDEYLGTLGPPGDIIQRLYARKSRGRMEVWEVMLEEGFEDCDWIGIEKPASYWDEIASMDQLNATLELHVPCREPISHLMSQCNYFNKHFHCDAERLDLQVKRCLVQPHRFNLSTFQQNENITTKCFNPIPIDGYLDYIGERLEKKRIENDYIHRDTNSPRNKTAECIWYDDELMAKVKEIMIRDHDYYKFCDQCIGSNDDLLR